MKIKRKRKKKNYRIPENSRNIAELILFLTRDIERVKNVLVEHRNHMPARRKFWELLERRAEAFVALKKITEETAKEIEEKIQCQK